MQRDNSEEILSLTDFAFVSARVSACSSTGIQELSKRGFRVVERSLTLELDRTVRPQHGFPIDHVRKAVTDDLPTLVRIAKTAFRYDRFHQDRKIPTAIADRIKVEWVMSFFMGTRGREMLVAVDSDFSDKPVGFLLVGDGPNGERVIDLIAVDKEHLQRGHATRLVHAFLGLPTEAMVYRVGTQSTNTESLRLYTRLGFRTIRESVSLHFHNSSFTEMTSP